MPFSARCFHQRQPRNAVGTAAIAAIGSPAVAPRTTVTAVAAPATISWRRDSCSTSRRVFVMRRSVRCSRRLGNSWRKVLTPIHPGGGLATGYDRTSESSARPARGARRSRSTAPGEGRRNARCRRRGGNRFLPRRHGWRAESTSCPSGAAKSRSAALALASSSPRRSRFRRRASRTSSKPPRTAGSSFIHGRPRGNASTATPELASFFLRMLSGKCRVLCSSEFAPSSFRHRASDFSYISLSSAPAIDRPSSVCLIRRKKSLAS